MYRHPNFAEETMVVKTIARVTYWLGILCVAAALFSRLMNILGFEAVRMSTKGNPIDFRSFLDAALLFLFSSIASSLYARLDS
jgi:hypothetical protein